MCIPKVVDNVHVSLCDVLQILEKPLLPQAASQLFTAVLKGLNVHGQHDAGKSSLLIRSLQHYELLVRVVRCIALSVCLKVCNRMVLILEGCRQKVKKRNKLYEMNSTFEENVVENEPINYKTKP